MGGTSLVFKATAEAERRTKRLRWQKVAMHLDSAVEYRDRADKVTLRWSVARPVARRRKPQGKGGWSWNTAGKSGKKALASYASGMKTYSLLHPSGVRAKPALYPKYKP